LLAGHVGNRDAELRFARHHFQALARPNVFQRVKFLDLGGNPHGNGAGIKGRDGTDAAASGA